MSTLELFNLSLMVVTASCLIFRPALINKALKSLTAIVIILSSLQLIVSAYSWRYFTGYVLISLLITWTLARHRVNNSIATKRILQVSLLISLSLALLPWSIFLAVPDLPRPIGPYPLGTKIFRWVDTSRQEEITDDTLDRRSVIVQAWYPTDAKVTGNHAPYLDGLGKLPEKIATIPSVVFDRYNQIDTYAVLDGPISTAHAKWPVILFLTGNASSRSFYTSLITHIASLGYIVLAIDHPYEAMITQLADGSVVKNVERHIPGEPNLLNFMARRVQTRIADVKFVVDELNEKTYADDFFSHLDADRIGIAGHSLGGASGAMAMAFDPRIKAAVNIDGTTYGDLPDTSAAKPFLLIESKKDNSERFLRYEQGNQKLYQHFGGGLRYELSDADHYSFTDVPMLLTSPARSLVATLFDIGNVPEQTSRSTAVMVAEFFSDAMQEHRINLDSLAGTHDNIIKKNFQASHGTQKTQR